MILHEIDKYNIKWTDFLMESEQVITRGFFFFIFCKQVFVDMESDPHKQIYLYGCESDMAENLSKFYATCSFHY